MIASNAHQPSPADALDLKGVRILLVEDSWHLGVAMKNLLQVLGADVAGPAATAAEAERLLLEQPPDVALVDFHLRDDERADALIDRLHDRGVHVVVISGYSVVPLAPEKVVAILKKPVTQSQLLATLRPLVAKKQAS
jgi:DNA-binding NtrC family response regulator